jgi:hypothetical protein
MPQFFRQVALVSESSEVALADVMQCSAALARQATAAFTYTAA